jgi:hypothetical protein
LPTLAKPNDDAVEALAEPNDAGEGLVGGSVPPTRPLFYEVVVLLETTPKGLQLLDLELKTLAWKDLDASIWCSQHGPSLELLVLALVGEPLLEQDEDAVLPRLVLVEDRRGFALETLPRENLVSLSEEGLELCGYLRSGRRELLNARCRSLRRTPSHRGSCSPRDGEGEIAARSIPRRSLLPSPRGPTTSSMMAAPATTTCC